MIQYALTVAYALANVIALLIVLIGSVTGAPLPADIEERARMRSLSWPADPEGDERGKVHP